MLSKRSFDYPYQMRMLSVGVPVLTGPAGGWNFWPLLGIPLALLLAFRWLRVRRYAWIAVIAVLAGLAWADAISAWGVLPVTAGSACIAAVATVLRRGRRPSRPPTV
jgi:hypothetical protein